jgi:hypothetical protein
MRKFENEEYTLEANFYWDGIRFETLEEMIKTIKINTDFTWEYVRDYYLDLQTNEPEYLALVEECRELWYDENVRPWTAKEIFSLQNQEQKYLLLSLIGADEIEKEMEPTLVDRKVLSKSQPRFDIKSKGSHKLTKRFKKDELIEDNITYEDIYELYKFDKSKLNTNNDVYFVKCKDTSTDRVYYIYVDGRDNRCNSDAISAIAWTMRDPDGEPFTPEMYLQLKAEA